MLLRERRRTSGTDAAVGPGHVRGAARTPGEGHAQMTGAAEQAVVVEPALAAAVGDRHDVIGFPPGALGAPGAPRRAVGGGRLAPSPFTVRLRDVQAAQPADALVPL